MKNFVMYHNPDAMGSDVESMPGLSIVTDKEPKDIYESRVWLLTGRGSPRKYFLRSWFMVDQIEPEPTGKFKSKLSGKSGKVFDPMIELNQEPWFLDFLRSQGSFAFGFQAIKDERFVRGLENTAGLKRAEG